MSAFVSMNNVVLVFSLVVFLFSVSFTLSWPPCVSVALSPYLGLKWLKNIKWNNCFFTELNASVYLKTKIKWLSVWPRNQTTIKQEEIVCCIKKLFLSINKGEVILGSNKLSWKYLIVAIKLNRFCRQDDERMSWQTRNCRLFVIAHAITECLHIFY